MTVTIIIFTVMAFTVIIVESPAKCQKIEGFLGTGYKCIASYGHICELNGLQSIDIKNNFKPTFIQCTNKKQQISKIKKLISEASDVLLATDDDREGEAIAWHLCKVFKLPIKTTKRIIFHEITETAIKKAVQEPTLLNMNVVYAQQARQILDLLVGYKLSPILWEKISYKTKSGLSAGRCQTPALRLIYDNQKDIDMSPGRKVYNTVGYFTGKNLGFSLNFNHENEKTITQFLEESINFDYIYNCGNIRKTMKNPPTPLTTSGIQQLASNELRISPKETMSACQKLYEGGYITYMRTDSTTYSMDFIEKAIKYIEKTYGTEYVKDNIEEMAERKDVKAQTPNTQEAHEAIRPTNIDCIDINKDLGPREVKLYKLIRKVTLESCMPPANYNSITCEITSPNNHLYKYSTEQVVFPGFRIVDGYEKENSDFIYLQNIKNGSKLNYKKITSKVSVKDLKTHYTEARLVQLLEKNGIGRPSTYSSLVDKIQERGYVKCDNVTGKNVTCVDFELEDTELSEIKTTREFGNEKNKLVIQPLGILVIEFLITHFDDLFQYEYTKDMEDTLDMIANGNKVWHQLCDECHNEINRLSEGVANIKRETIQIDNNHTYMIAKYGPVIKQTNGDKVNFIPVKSDIDIDKLRRGEYNLDEITLPSQFIEKKLGLYKGKNVVIKKGKYGLYVEHDKIKKSLNINNEGRDTNIYPDNNIITDSIICSSKDITIDEAIKILYPLPSLNNEISSSLSIIRTIDDNTTIRTGKYGDYIYHKKPGWSKPSFLKLTGFINEYGKDYYKTCELSIIKKWVSANKVKSNKDK